jgi:DNA-3-methyladenine glycosylase II
MNLQPSQLNALTEESFALGLNELAKRDRDFAWIIEKLGNPPRWSREGGFPGLIQIILEQQVSLASAKAIFARLRKTIAPLTPENFLSFDDVQLKALGFSRQKIEYSRALAAEIFKGELDLARLATWDEHSIRSRLKQIKGIGDWTVDIYLLMALQRPNVFPKGDLALAIAAQNLKKLPVRPTPAFLAGMAENWHPWKAIAARLLWHYYLSKERERI